MQADAFPGVMLAVAFDGEVTEARAGVDAPFGVENLVGWPLHVALGLADDAPETGALQLWLASTDRAPLELWHLARRDPPAKIAARAGRPALALDFGPVLVDDAVASVMVFVRAAAERARATATIRAVAPPGAEDPRFVAAFVQSATDLLHQCDGALQRITGDQEARGALQRLFRAIHTIKGEAQGADLEEIRNLAHAIEDHLASLHGRPIGAGELERVTVGVGRLRAAIAALGALAPSAGDAMTGFHARARPLLATLQRTFERWQQNPRTRRYVEELDRQTHTLGELARHGGLTAYAGRAIAMAQSIQATVAANRPPRSLLARIEAQLDELEIGLGVYHQLHREVTTSEDPVALITALTQWGHSARGAGLGDLALSELASALSRAGVLALGRALRVSDGAAPALLRDLVSDAAAMFAPASGVGPSPTRDRALGALRDASTALAVLGDRPETRTIAAALARVVASLTEVSLDELSTQVAQRALRLAGELGKHVAVDVDAVGVTVAPVIHQALSKILLHAVRNALDHGVEAPPERAAAGKPRAGQIKIRVDAIGSRIVAEIVDDGRGIDVDAIRRSAIDRGKLTAAAAATATPADLLDLLFEPGFTTTAAVTMVSGRGVGMDVIRSAARELGGRAELTTWPGRGTRIRIDLPADGQVLAGGGSSDASPSSAAARPKTVAAIASSEDRTITTIPAGSSMTSTSAPITVVGS